MSDPILSNPYPQDNTINRVIALFTGYLDDAAQDVAAAKAQIQTAESKKKAYLDSGVLRTVEQTIASLPTRDCPLCGHKAVDKAPLLSLVNQFQPYEDDGYFWKIFWDRADDPLVFGWECHRCGAEQVTMEKFEKMVHQSWQRADADPRKKNFALTLFDAYPSVETIGLSKLYTAWYLIFENGEIWRIMGPKEQAADRLGLAI